MFKYSQKIRLNNFPKIFLLQIILVCLSIHSVMAQEYKLVWYDEFDGTAVDLSKWEFQIGNGQGGWGNNERQYYRAENASVEDGLLTITAKQESFNGFSYTSTRMRTLNKGDWKYGKLEIRAKMPFGKGIWPAIWMMPTDNVYGGWAASGEIDIMEYLGHETNKVHGTLHYGGSWPNNRNSGKSYSITGNGFNDDFHTFTIVWEEGRFDWYVDSVLYQTQTNWYTTGYEFPAPFDQRFHMILNMAVGGNWPGSPDSTTQFPQQFVIDYVRVYQQSATAVSLEENQVPAEFLLEQNYPNPFNSQTVINYSLSEPGYIKLSLYDIMGRLVKVLVNQRQESGVYKLSLDAADLSTGSYIYSLNAGSTNISRKLLLIK
ncbi:MAG: family 16 glycosylhydrolase [Ignavibacteriaceae bacterium]